MIPCAILIHCHDLEDVQALVNATQYLDEHQIRRGRVGHIYTTGVRYRREQHDTLPGVERVQTAEEAAAMGDGDCDDLGPWLAASRRVIDGQDARAKAVVAPGIGYHVVVQYPNGRIEDPSARLGMLEGTVAGRKADRRAHLRRLASKLLNRATTLAHAAARANPYTAAGRALLGQAKRAARAAVAASNQAEELDNDPSAPGDETDAADDEGEDQDLASMDEAISGIGRRHGRHHGKHGRRSSSPGGGDGGGGGLPDDGGDGPPTMPARSPAPAPDYAPPAPATAPAPADSSLDAMADDLDRCDCSGGAK